MTILLKGACLAIYLLALVAPLIAVPAGARSALQYCAAILLGAHLLEVPLAYKSIRRYRGPLAISIALTVLFGFLHWLPLAREARRSASAGGLESPRS